MWVPGNPEATRHGHLNRGISFISLLTLLPHTFHPTNNGRCNHLPPPPPRLRPQPQPQSQPQPQPRRRPNPNSLSLLGFGLRFRPRIPLKHSLLHRPRKSGQFHHGSLPPERGAVATHRSSLQRRRFRRHRWNRFRFPRR